MRVEPLTPEDTGTWLALRQCLWPNTSADEHLAEIAALLANVDTLQILVRDTEGAALGFAEAGLRRDHVNGTDTSRSRSWKVFLLCPKPVGAA